MLAQRLRRWPKIKLTSGQRLIFGIIWRIFLEGRWGERREKEGGGTAKKKQKCPLCNIDLYTALLTGALCKKRPQI